LMSNARSGALPMGTCEGRLILCCRQCGIALTTRIRPMPATMVLCEEDDKDHIPPGYFKISDGSFFHVTSGEYLVNLKDMINTRHHPDTRRLNGCCGLDGLDGKNTVCSNGHEVGVERSDCWMPHAAHFASESVELVAAPAT